MYCRNCGKELEENIKFCSECGTNVTDYEDINKQDTLNNNKPSKGKGIASMVLGIIAIYFGLSIFSGSIYYEDSGFAFGIGYILIPMTLSIISNCLGVKERKSNKNGFNLTGLILSYITYGLSFLTFFSVL